LYCKLVLLFLIYTILTFDQKKKKRAVEEERALSREKLERDALLPPEAVSSFDHGCLLHPSLSQVINARSFQFFPFCPFLKWPKTKGNKQP
jgi:hypothetical protein